jgi:ferredoxin-NADP reductase
MTVRLLIASTVKRDAWPVPRVRELTVAPLHRNEFPPASPGDHVQLQHVNGIRRDYSLLGPSTQASSYRIAIQREEDGRGGSVLFHRELAVGDLVFVSYPQPGIRIDPTATQHAFIAGGIGITAILGLLNGVSTAWDREVHYCVRDRAGAVYIDELLATGARVVLHESARGGRLDVAELVRAIPADATVYYCGPKSLMDAVAQATAGRDPEHVRSETFSGVSANEGERLGDAFDAWLTLSQRVIHVDENESLLNAMRREGIRVDYSCEGGACGTCVVEVVDGAIDHRDLCLTDDERQRMMTTCVSRGRGPISLQA